MGLYEMRARRINYLLDTVSRQLPRDSLDIRSENEEVAYLTFLADAEQHMEKYGFWPTFEMVEIEYDDPILDIYGD